MTALAYVVGVLCALVALPWAFFHFFVGKALPAAKTRLRSDDQVRYRKDRWHIFEPAQSPPRCGYILYQGGFVDAIAYAWLGHALARRGMTVIIPELPQRAAMARPLEADDIIEAFPEIESWFISGHSLGGIASAFFAKQGRHRGRLAGQVILASFLRESRDMSALVDLPTVTLYGTRDGHAEKFEPNFKHFSSNAELRCIEGANHGQFGEYGFHLGDQTPQIGREQQQAAIVEYIEEHVSKRLAETQPKQDAPPADASKAARA